MISSDFRTIAHGKWILAGEHSVLRGHEALVFPLNSRHLELQYQNTTASLKASYHGKTGEEMHMLFWSVLEQGAQILGRSLNAFQGVFQLYSNIPIGAGMGASAALSVATARWFAHQKMIEARELSSFAQKLENLFHGQSSGLDIAGVNSNQPIYFKQGRYTDIHLNWQPKWFLSSCQQIGVTSHCIQQIAELQKQDPKRADALDIQMGQSAKKAHYALEACDEKNGLPMLAEAINMANECFNQWSLISENLQKHMLDLHHAGAIATKPTGSGGGGYVISLWPSTPPQLLHPLIPLPASSDLD